MYICSARLLTRNAQMHLRKMLVLVVDPIRSKEFGVYGAGCHLNHTPFPPNAFSPPLARATAWAAA